MKYVVGILTFLLCMSVARSDEPKFHFGDCVKVIDGFYRGCSGKVRGYTLAGEYFSVDLVCKNEDVGTPDITVKNLQLQKDSLCERK